MPKKKPAKNAFSFYLDDAMDELRRRGINVRGKQDAVPLVHKEWKEMTDAEKAPYEELAKQCKLMNQGRPRPGRLDCTGNPIDNRIDMDQVILDQRKEQRKYLLDRWQAMRSDQVLDEHFYLISFQSFFEFPNEEGFQPCEVACVDFSLRTGINREWHAMINPGPIKMGLGAESKIFSEKTHQIPTWGFEAGRTDHHTLWNELVEFVNPGMNRKILPPLFSKISELKKNTFCMDYLAQLAGTSNRLSKIFQWEGLALTLYEHAGIQTPSINIIEDGSSTSMYDYEANTKCDYHDEIECVYCAVLIIKKCCFWMSDAFTKIFKFDITENHLPVRQVPNYTVMRPEDLHMAEPSRKQFLGSKSVPRYDPNLPLSLQKNVASDISASESISSSSTYGARDIRFRPKYQMVDTSFSHGRGMVIAGNDIPVLSDDRLETLSVVTTDTIDDVGSSILSDSESDATCQADDEESVVSFGSRSRAPMTQPKAGLAAGLAIKRTVTEAAQGDNNTQVPCRLPPPADAIAALSHSNVVKEDGSEEDQGALGMDEIQIALENTLKAKPASSSEAVTPIGVLKRNPLASVLGKNAYPFGAVRGRGRFIAMQRAKMDQ